MIKQKKHNMVGSHPVRYHYLEVKKPMKQLAIFTTCCLAAYMTTVASKQTFGLPPTTKNNNAEMLTYYRPTDVRDTMAFDFVSIQPIRPKKD